MGPESAGAHPGPVCYRKNGHLAVTDANVLLGRVRPEFFPSIFGPDENEPLDAAAARAAFEKLAAEEVNPFYAAEHAKAKAGGAPKTMSAEEVAFGFLKVANEAMCRPIREITQMRGFDITTHTLASFGGAGGQHACVRARVCPVAACRRPPPLQPPPRSPPPPPPARLFPAAQWPAPSA